MPLLFIPFVFSTCSDAYVALGRIGTFLTAEELDDPYVVEPDSKFAVQLDGDFVWEANLPEKDANKAARKKVEQTKANHGKEKKSTELPTVMPPDKEKDEQQENKPFELKDMKLKVPHGSFVAIVGRVGSGKSSLLQAMIGEMRKTRGQVCRIALYFVIVLDAAYRLYLAGTSHTFRRQRG